MDKNFNELLKKIYALLQPLGYRKEASNYRLFCSDGLCRIISIQRNKWNTNEQCEFLINIGVWEILFQSVILRNMIAKSAKEWTMKSVEKVNGGI